MIRAEHFRAVLDAFLAKVRDREGGVTGQQSHSRSCGDGRRDTEAAVEAAAAEAGRRAQEQAARKMEGSGGQRAEGAHAGSERQQAQGGVTEERGWGLQQGYTAAKEAGRGRAGGQLAGPTRREEQGCVVPGGDQLSSHPWELREAPLGPYLALEGLPRPFPRGLAFSYGKEQQQEQCNQQHEEQDKASKAAAATAAEEDIAKPEAVFQEDDEAAVGPGCATSATAVASSSPGAAAPSLALLDYHVCYSLSYQVPLMCFRATWPDGRPLSWASMLQLFPAWGQQHPGEQLGTFVTLQEHPLLPGPCWCVLHPCNTAAVMALAMGLGEASRRTDGDREGGHDDTEGMQGQVHGGTGVACSAGREGEGSWVTAGLDQMHVFEEQAEAVPDLEELLTGVVAAAAVLELGSACLTGCEGSGDGGGVAECQPGAGGQQLGTQGGMDVRVTGAAGVEGAGDEGGSLPQVSWPGGDVPVCEGDPEVWGARYVRLWLSLVGPQVGLGGS